MSYVKLTPEFIQGLNKWIESKKFKREEIVEVFAGSGKLSKAINLPKENVTDDYSWQGSEDSRDEDWFYSAEENVYKEHEIATETIRRFVVNNKKIRLLIMGFPPNGVRVPDTSAYEVAKELSKSFKDALILYIGTDGYKSRIPIASESFFDHIEDVDDDSVLVNEKLENFDSLVREKYVQELKDEIIYAQLIRFIPCEDGEEDCLGVLERSTWCQQKNDII